MSTSSKPESHLTTDPRKTKLPLHDLHHTAGEKESKMGPNRKCVWCEARGVGCSALSHEASSEGPQEVFLVRFSTFVKDIVLPACSSDQGSKHHPLLLAAINRAHPGLSADKAQSIADWLQNNWNPNVSSKKNDTLLQAVVPLCERCMHFPPERRPESSPASLPGAAVTQQHAQPSRKPGAGRPFTAKPSKLVRSKVLPWT